MAKLSLSRYELKKKLKEQENTRKLCNMYNSLLTKKEVPVNLKNQIMEYIKYKKVMPFQLEMLTTFKDLSSYEINNWIQKIQISMKK